MKLKKKEKLENRIMSKKASWPINKGIFRNSYQTDFGRQRSPSPIVEMPLSPDPESYSPNNGFPMSPPPLRISTSMERSLSPRRSMSPFSPTLNKTIREIPIEVQHEVKFRYLKHFFFLN